MSFFSYRPAYLQLIEDFVANRICACRFSDEFTSLWILGRDSGKSDSSEDVAKERLLDRVVSQIFTACDVYQSDDEYRTEYEYSEEELRSFVLGIFTLNEHLFHDSLAD